MRREGERWREEDRAMLRGGGGAEGLGYEVEGLGGEGRRQGSVEGRSELN